MTHEEFVQGVVTLIRRTPRQGRPDGASEIARYVARWTDENTGRHTVELLATSEQDVRDQLEPYISSNDMVIRKVAP
jgi:hypothetical protein